ncbi:MAG: transglycosylase SLT domain-containing protein [Nitrospiraceae bacterium]|nr:transglycosylase SLT domain-containing protein [Nitrospiraceae bacterium]
MSRGPVKSRGLVFFVSFLTVFFLYPFNDAGAIPEPLCSPLFSLVGYVERNSRPHQGFPDALRIGRAILSASRQSRLPLYILVALAQEESSFNPLAINAASRDYGLFQIHYPFWKKYFAKRKGGSNRPIRRTDIMEVEVNAQMAADILAYDLKLSGGDVVQMLGRYSGRTGLAHENYIRNILRYSLSYKQFEMRRQDGCPGP